MIRRKARGGHAAPRRGPPAVPEPKRTARSRSGAAKRRAGRGGTKGAKPPAGKQAPGPGGRARGRVRTPRTAGGPMGTRGERARAGTLERPARGESPASPGGRAPREGLAPTTDTTMLGDWAGGGRAGSEPRPEEVGAVDVRPFTGAPFPGVPLAGKPIKGERIAAAKPGAEAQRRKEARGREGRGPRGPRARERVRARRAPARLPRTRRRRVAGQEACRTGLSLARPRPSVPPRVVQAALFLAGLVVAGCVQPEPSPALVARGSEPAAFAGYDYGGRRAERGDGDLALRVEGPAATLLARFTFGGVPWEIDLSRLRALTRDATLRAPPGDDAPRLPPMHALAALAGTARATVNGSLLHDPATGLDEVAVGFVLTDTAPHDPENLRVRRTEGRGTYHPRHPDAGYAAPGVLQAFLDVSSLGPPRAHDALAVVEDHLAGAQTEYERAEPFDVLDGALAAYVNVSVTNPREVQVLAKFTFRVLGPAGDEVVRQEFVPVLRGQEGRWRATLALPAPLEPGTYTFEATGAGVEMEYAAEIGVDYPDPLQIHVVYTDVEVGG